MKESRVVSDNVKAVVFNTTPVMSTYLLAFIVGEFDYVEATYTNEGVYSTGEEGTRKVCAGGKWV